MIGYLKVFLLLLRFVCSYRCFDCPGQGTSGFCGLGVHSRGLQGGWGVGLGERV